MHVCEFSFIGSSFIAIVVCGVILMFGFWRFGVTDLTLAAKISEGSELVGLLQIK